MTQSLTELLVGTHAHEYHNNAVFRYEIDALATMLPAMVDGLAQKAHWAERRRVAEVEAARTAPPLTREQLLDDIERLRRNARA